jgi:hypothetical protein
LGEEGAGGEGGEVPTAGGTAGGTALGAGGEEKALVGGMALWAGGEEGAPGGTAPRVGGSVGGLAGSTGDWATATGAGAVAVPLGGEAPAPEIGGGLPAGAKADIFPDSQTHRSQTPQESLL